MFKIDDYTSELRVCDDSGEIHFTQIYNLKFRSLREGAYVRIRSANLENHHQYERTFGLKPHSNILTLPYPSRLARDLHVDYSVLNRKMDQALLKQDRIMHPVIMSYITEKDMKYAPVTTFDQIIAEDGKSGRGKERNKYRVRFSLDAVQANKSAEMVKLYNADTKATKENNAKAVPKGFKRIFQTQMFVRDASIDSNQFVKLLFYSHDMNEEKAKEVFGVSPDDLSASKDEAAKIDAKLKKLQQFNVWVDAVVERSPAGYLMLRDTTITA